MEYATYGGCPREIDWDTISPSALVYFEVNVSSTGTGEVRLCDESAVVPLFVIPISEPYMTPKRAVMPAYMFSGRKCYHVEIGGTVGQRHSCYGAMLCIKYPERARRGSRFCRIQKVS